MKSLNWVSRFLDETPGDSEVGGKPRQVLGACWSRVKPSYSQTRAKIMVLQNG